MLNPRRLTIPELHQCFPDPVAGMKVHSRSLDIVELMNEMNDDDVLTLEIGRVWNENFDPDLKGRTPAPE